MLELHKGKWTKKRMYIQYVINVWIRGSTISITATAVTKYQPSTTLLTEDFITWPLTATTTAAAVQ